MYASRPNNEPLWQAQQDLNVANTWAQLVRVTFSLCVWAAHAKAVISTSAPQPLSIKGPPKTFKKSPEMV